MVFLDTPGLHEASHALNKVLVDTALSTLNDVDAVLFMAEVSNKGMAASKQVAAIIRQAKMPTVLALNKIDLLPDKSALLPRLQEASSWGEFKAVVPVSALKGDGTSLVVEELAKLLPQGDPVFPEDMITDLSMRFLAAELIREKVFRLTQKEIPYSCAVTVEEFLEPASEDAVTAISATIHVGAGQPESHCDRQGRRHAEKDRQLCPPGYGDHDRRPGVSGSIRAGGAQMVPANPKGCASWVIEKCLIFRVFVSWFISESFYRIAVITSRVRLMAYSEKEVCRAWRSDLPFFDRIRSRGHFPLQIEKSEDRHFAGG